MTAPADSLDERGIGNRRTGTAWTLAGMELFVSLSALAGGSALMTDQWSMPRE
ncbi:hypothetical protein ACFUEJ_01070 [Gordonia sp. NPDC057258]|nr:hypothetical protein [Gordonia sp. JH63]